MSNVIECDCSCGGSFFSGILFTLFYGILFLTVKYLHQNQRQPVKKKLPEREYENGNFHMNCLEQDIYYVVGPKYSGKTALATHIASKYSPVFTYCGSDCTWKDIKASIGNSPVMILDECQLSRRQLKNNIDYLCNRGIKDLIIVENQMGSWLRQIEPCQVFVARHMTHTNLKKLYKEMDCDKELEYDLPTYLETCRKLSNHEFAVMGADRLITYHYDGGVVESYRLYTEDDRQMLQGAYDAKQQLLNKCVTQSSFLSLNDRRIKYLERSLHCNKKLLKKSRDKVRSLKKSIRNNRRDESIYNWIFEDAWSEPVASQEWSEPDASATGWSEPVTSQGWSEPDASATGWSEPEPLSEDFLDDERERDKAKKTINRAILKWVVARRWRRLAEKVCADIIQRAAYRVQFNRILDELQTTQNNDDVGEEISIVECELDSHLIAFDNSIDVEIGDHLVVNEWQDLENALDQKENVPIWCNCDITDSLEDPKVGAKIATYPSWVGFKANLSQFKKSHRNPELFVFNPSALDETERRGVYFNVCFEGVNTFRTFDAICNHFVNDELMLCYSVKNKRIEWLEPNF